MASAEMMTTGRAGRRPQRLQFGRQQLDAAAVDRLAVDGVAAVGGHGDDDLARPLAQLVASATGRLTCSSVNLE
jgi:hypothetical protein